MRRSTLLVRAVLLLAMRMARDVGCAGVIVDAKAEAVVFYEKLGFVVLEIVGGEIGDRPLPVSMFLEVGQVLDLRD